MDALYSLFLSNDLAIRNYNSKRTKLFLEKSYKDSLFSIDQENDSGFHSTSRSCSPGCVSEVEEPDDGEVGDVAGEDEGGDGGGAGGGHDQRRDHAPAHALLPGGTGGGPSRERKQSADVNN